MTGVLTTRSLSKDYGDGYGVRSVELDIGGGEVVMLVGPNGAGKSTLLTLVAGMLAPTAGSATVGGAEVGSVDARAATSYVPDTPVLYDDLSVWEHLEYVARMHRTPDWEDYADDLLDLFGLTDRADDLPARFSRGLRQKTALAVGLIRPFGLLLIDEPFAGLDRPGQQTLVDVLADVADQGAAVVVSTHQLDLLRIATRCIGLRDGEVVYDGVPSAGQIDELVGG